MCPVVLHSSEEAHRSEVSNEAEQEGTADSTKTPGAVASYWLEAAALELQAFCEGKHCCFDGLNRTKLVRRMTTLSTLVFLLSFRSN